ncbi:MAG: hypothetical protein IJT20_05185 [Synergistaceae bacterium]|nr:hypothetical protein [Synergistaceae bacterium]
MRSKKFFLLGVFLLAALLTSLDTPSFAAAKVYGIWMQDPTETTTWSDGRFYNGTVRINNPTIEVAHGGSLHIGFAIDRDSSNIYADPFHYTAYLQSLNSTAGFTYTFRGETKSVTPGVQTMIKDNLRLARPNAELHKDVNNNYVELYINVNNSIPAGKYQFAVNGYPSCGYQQAGVTPEMMTQNFTIEVVASKEAPTISGPDEITIMQGAKVSVDFTGTNTVRWDHGNSRLKRNADPYIKGIEFDYADDPTKCTITITATPNEAIYPKGEYEDLPIYAYNPYGTRAEKTLRINFSPDADHSDATVDSIVPKTITIKQGETGWVTLTGSDYLRDWVCGDDEDNLQGNIDSVRLSFDKNSPKICYAYVNVNPDAKAGVHKILIYGLNGAGKPGTDIMSRYIVVNVTLNEDHMKPTIDSDEEVTVVQGGVATATFTGKYAKGWIYDGELSSDIISDITFDYSKSTNRCNVKVTAAENAAVGTYTKKIYALNAIGQKSDPATLTIKVVQNEAHTAATIDADEIISVVPGKTATAVFTGKHVRSWAVDRSDMAKYAWISEIECSYADNPDRCEMYVMTNTSVDAVITTADIKVYAYNAVGQVVTTPAYLHIVAANPDDFKNPVIDEAESVTVIAGGTAKAVFTGQNIRAWDYDRNFSDDIHDIELNYSSNPNRCEVLVTASSNAKAGTYTLPIYAANAAGEATSSTLKVTVTTQTYAPATIDKSAEVSVKAGGTVKAVFTGTNVRAWKYGKLPAAVKAVELDYSSNPNRCEVLVTASSTATAGTYSVPMYAYNEVGQEVSSTLKITVTTDTYAAATIDKNEEVTVKAGGTVRTVFTGKNVNAWKYGNLPAALKAVELNYSTNTNRCEVLVTASSTAEAGTYSTDIYAYNAVGEEVSATLTVTVTEESSSTTYASATIDGNGEVEVIAGGTARAIFTGKNVKTWRYGNLPDGVTAVELNYSTNTNRCEVLVTTSEAVSQDTTATIDIYAYNEVGEVVASPAKLTVSIITEGTSEQPTITTAPSSVNVVPGGTVSAVFKGEGISFWTCDNASFLLDGVELSYQDDTNTCTVFITTASYLIEGLSDDITVTAYNNQGDSVSKTLTVNIVEDTNAPKIDVPPMKDQFKSVVPGGTVKTVLRGTNIVTWTIGNDTPSFLTVVARPKPDDSNICEIFMTAASTAKTSDVITAEADSGYFTVYGHDSTGNETPMPLFIDVVDPSSITSAKPEISTGDQSVSVAPGGSVSATFKAANVYDWNYSELTTTELSSVNQNYDRDNDPSTNTVTVVAASTAKEGDYHVTVYAYNENGLEDSADLKVTVSSSGSNSGTGSIGSSSGGGCDMGFAGLGVLALALTLMKKYSN